MASAAVHRSSGLMLAEPNSSTNRSPAPFPIGRKGHEPLAGRFSPSRSILEGRFSLRSPAPSPPPLLEVVSASRWETRHSSPGRWHRRCLRIPAQTGHFPPPGAYGYHRHKWCCQTGRTQTDKIWGGPTKRQRRTATTLRWPRQPLPEQCLGLSPAPGGAAALAWILFRTYLT